MYLVNITTHRQTTHKLRNKAQHSRILDKNLLTDHVVHHTTSYESAHLLGLCLHIYVLSRYAYNCTTMLDPNPSYVYPAC